MITTAEKENSMKTLVFASLAVCISSIMLGGCINHVQKVRACNDAVSLPSLQQIISDVNDPHGRTILKFQHSSSSNWGYASAQTDIFYVVVPNAPSAGRPMRVILHSAGHSATAVLRYAFANPQYAQYQADPGFYGLYLDCRGNSKVDWWWGWHSIKDDPAKEINTKTL